MLIVNSKSISNSALYNLLLRGETIMSNIKDLQAATDNANRHSGTIAKKVRAKLKTEIPEMVSEMINLATGVTGDLSPNQRFTALKALVTMGIDVEKTVDALNRGKKEEREEGKRGNHTAEIIPYIKVKK